jgi:hypothetical protein
MGAGGGVRPEARASHRRRVATAGPHPLLIEDADALDLCRCRAPWPVARCLSNGRACAPVEPIAHWQGTSWVSRAGDGIAARGVFWGKRAAPARPDSLDPLPRSASLSVSTTGRERVRAKTSGATVAGSKDWSYARGSSHALRRSRGALGGASGTLGRQVRHRVTRPAPTRFSVCLARFARLLGSFALDERPESTSSDAERLSQSGAAPAARNRAAASERRGRAVRRDG